MASNVRTCNYDRVEQLLKQSNPRRSIRKPKHATHLSVYHSVPEANKCQKLQKQNHLLDTCIDSNIANVNNAKDSNVIRCLKHSKNKTAMWTPRFNEHAQNEAKKLKVVPFADYHVDPQDWEVRT